MIFFSLPILHFIINTLHTSVSPQQNVMNFVEERLPWYSWMEPTLSFRGWLLLKLTKKLAGCAYEKFWAKKRRLLFYARQKNDYTGHYHITHSACYGRGRQNYLRERVEKTACIPFLASVSMLVYQHT